MEKYQMEQCTNIFKIPTFDSLKSFVLRQCNALDSVDFGQTDLVQKVKRPTIGRGFSGYNYNIKCKMCPLNHPLYKCPDFLKMNSLERLIYAKINSICTYCLSPQHATRNCNSKSTCRTCSQKHHSLLHLLKTNAVDNNYQQHVPISTDCGDQSTKSHEFLNCTASNSQRNNLPSAQTNVFHSTNSQRTHSQTSALLSTAVVDIYDSLGHTHKVRILFDCGSQTNYISENLCKRLRLSRTDWSFYIQGLGDKTTSKRLVSFTIKPSGQTNPRINFEAIILQKLCPSIPSHVLGSISWPHTANLKLANPEFFKPRTIDILLGVEDFPYLLNGLPIPGKENEPVALPTVFGYILMGKIPNFKSSTCTTSLFHFLIVQLITI